MDIKTCLVILLLLGSAVHADFEFIEIINGTGINGSKPYKIFGNPITVTVGDKVYVGDRDDGIVYEMEDNEKDEKIGKDQLIDFHSIAYLNGRLFVCSPSDRTVYVRKSSVSLRVFAEDNRFYQSPLSIAYYNNTYYILSNDKRIYVYDEDESYLDSISLRLYPGEYISFNDMTIYNGLFYMTDTANHRIDVFHPDGTYKTGFGKDLFEEPAGIYATSDRIFATDSELGKLMVFDPNGHVIDSVSSVPVDEDTNITFKEPTDVWVNGSYVYVVDPELKGVIVLNYSDWVTDKALPMISSANQSVSRLTDLMGSAERIGIDWDTSLTDRLVEAQVLVEKHDRSSLDLLNTIIEESDNEYSTLCNLIINRTEELKSYYENRLRALRSYKNTTEADQQIIELTIAIDEGRCKDAAEIAASLNRSIEELESERPVDNATVTVEVGRKKLERLEDRLERVKEMNEWCRQDVNLSAVEMMIMVAESKESTGQPIDKDIKNINDTLSEVESYLNEKCPKVADALSFISETEEKMKNTTENLERLAYARTIVYDDPDGAVQVCESILAGEPDDTVSFLIPTVLIVLIIILSYIYLHRHVKP